MSETSGISESEIFDQKKSYVLSRFRTEQDLSRKQMYPAEVTLLYGPYETYGVYRHKPQRLHGLMQRLRAINVQYTLKPISQLNRLSIVMREREIVRCDIRNLYFNMDFEGDVVAERIADVIDETRARIFHPSNKPKYPSIKEGTESVFEKRKKSALQFNTPAVHTSVSGQLDSKLKNWGKM